MSRPNRRRTPSRKPAIRRQLLRTATRLMAVLLLIAATGGAGWWLNRALTVHTWEIHGVPEATEVAIGDELNRLQPLDLLHAWPSRLRAELLQQQPDLAEVNITRILPGRLQIDATMRQPIALWRDANGVVQLVDGHGTAYRPLRRGEALDLPLLRVSADGVAPSVDLLLQLKQMDEQRYAKLSEWIGIDDGWEVNFDQGRCWLLPRGPQAAGRMQDILALMARPRWKDGDWRIDVRAPSRWFIRKSRIGGMA